MFITAKIAFICTSLSALQIYDFHIFKAVYSPLHGFISNQHNGQLPVGLLARLVEHYIAEVIGSNPVPYRPDFFFFRSSFHYCLRSVHNCEDRFPIHLFTAVQIYDFHIITANFHFVYHLLNLSTTFLLVCILWCFFSKSREKCL